MSIEQKLIKASQAYYNTDQQTMTDKQFDQLKQQLQQQDPNNPFREQVSQVKL